MKRILRILLLDYLIPRRRRHPRAEAVATRGRWTFLADCGQNRVTVMIRDAAEFEAELAKPVDR